MCSIRGLHVARLREIVVFTTILAVVIAVPLFAWVLWLIWCYFIARAHPQRAADIIEAAGIAFPFRPRRNPREPRA